MKAYLIAAAIGVSAAATPAAAVTTVDLDGVANASLDGSTGKTVALAQGRYRVTFSQGAFTAFNRFSTSTGCDAAGDNCTTGFENSARFIVNGITFRLGDGNANGGIGPISPGNGYFETAARSFANAGGYSQDFSVGAGGTNGNFFVFDDNLGDNSGGITLSIAAIPEPATWAMMILGFGVIGGALRRRRRTAARVVFA